jgi:uncharacterized protein (TIGR01777 family)
MKKVVLAGGSGFIGQYVAKRFRELGYRVMIVSREQGDVSWNRTDLTEAFEDAELVLNLAGKSINCRHNKENKRLILDSRLNTTQLIGLAINDCTKKPGLWVNASAVGVYKPSVEQAMTEEESVFGLDFLADVVSQWENTFFSFNIPDTRQVALRTSVVLGKIGGALKPLVLLSRLGLGGKQADGKQMFSWIHEEDYFQILLFLINNPALDNVINCTAPNPLSNKDFMQTLRSVMRVRVGIPAPALAIQVGSALIGTESGLILNSSYVIPKRLLDAGFTFKFPTVDSALKDLIAST